MKKFIFLIFSTLLIGLFIISCATSESKDDNPINIEKISFTQVINRAPIESDFQKDIELYGIISESNIGQNLEFEWNIEYLDLDIQETGNIYNSDVTDDVKIYNNYLEGIYFLEISSTNPLNAMLSIYKPGYFKVTFIASNIKEIKEKSVILKIGEPELPDLLVKVNIPKINNSNEEDYNGKFYLQKNSEPYKEIPAQSLKDEWYNTDIKINPFESFTVNSGTHILKTKSKSLRSITKNDSFDENDQLIYSVNNVSKSITTIPIVLNNIQNETTLSISKSGNKEWSEGLLYISYLTWGKNKEDKDIFNYFEKQLTNKTKSLNITFNDIYLSKIFIGSYGHKVLPNKYFIYFGPEGSEIDELDPKNLRDLPSLPYGYLLGKLGENGRIFPIGTGYTYVYNRKIKVYKQDKNNNFVLD